MSASFTVTRSWWSRGSALFYLNNVRTGLIGVARVTVKEKRRFWSSTITVTAPTQDILDSIRNQMEAAKL
jgi:hypothetical protein